MKIAFHLYHFSYRGSEVATFDYAYYNRRILNNISIIVVPKNSSQPPIPEVVSRFSKEFPIFYYDNIKELEQICINEKIDVFYVLKYGKNDGIFLTTIPTFVHCVFFTEEPHGKFYAGVSKSVAKKNNDNIEYPFLNHIVHLPNHNINFRKQLNIPNDAIVFGRHGGNDTFDIPFVKEAILEALDKRQDIYFLFCIKPNMFHDVIHPRVIYLDSFVDIKIKRGFINTCDCMIHSCSLGESFGLSILEFAFCDKPVITFNGGLWHKTHLDNLRDKAIIYSDKNELLNTLIKFNKKDFIK